MTNLVPKSITDLFRNWSKESGNASNPMKNIEDNFNKKLLSLNNMLMLMSENKMAELFKDNTTFKNIQHADEVKALLASVDDAFGLTNRSQADISTDEKLKVFLKAQPLKKYNEAVEKINGDENIQALLGTEIPDKIKTTLMKYVEINLKYRYYMFKYIQLNAFIPNFAMIVNEIHSDLFSGMTALTAYLHNAHKEAILKTIEGIEHAVSTENYEKLGAAEGKLKDLNINIAKSLEGTFKSVMEKSKEIETQSMQTLIKWIMDQQEQMAQEALKEAPKGNARASSASKINGGRKR